MNPSEQQYIPPPKLTGRMTQLNSRRIARYRLNVVQHPIRARCCGFGEKDRRSLDPPPILELTAEDINGELIPLNPMDTIYLVAQCELFSHNKTTNQTLVYAPWAMQSLSEAGSNERKPEHIRNLIGATVSNVYHLNNEKKNPGAYFIFHDLSIRTEGTFTLKFTFINIGNGFGNTDNEGFTRSIVHEEIFTDPFTVYSAKRFPGLTESTSLSRCFSKQGIKIPIRNDTFRRSVTSITTPNNATGSISSNSSPSSSPSLNVVAAMTSSTTTTSSSTTTTTTATVTAIAMENITLEQETNTVISLPPPERAHNYTRLPISDFLIPEQ